MIRNFAAIIPVFTTYVVWYRYLLVLCSHYCWAPFTAPTIWRHSQQRCLFSHLYMQKTLKWPVLRSFFIINYFQIKGTVSRDFLPVPTLCLRYEKSNTISQMFLLKSGCRRSRWLCATVNFEGFSPTLKEQIKPK